MEKRKKITISVVTILVIALDLYILLHHNPLDDYTQEIIKKVISCIILNAIYIVFLFGYDKIVILPIELWQNRQLIWKLAKNDFKTRYAGSYLGIIWAFVQPIITVLLYWFVFTIAIPSRATTLNGELEIPYVLWLIAGLVPWFYFSEVVNSGTSVLLDYDYLVKKVVFKIDTLPVVKAISSLFVHGFFVVFMLILFFAYHNKPTIYLLQIIYYSFCLIVLALGIIYATSAMVVFFRDLSQIINILLQMGMWVTPIMWNIAALEGKPAFLTIIMKLNPLFYIVTGYRNAMFANEWFWERPMLTLYFWGITLLLLFLGTTIFRKLQPHFADVL